MVGVGLPSNVIYFPYLIWHLPTTACTKVSIVYNYVQEIYSRMQASGRVYLCSYYYVALARVAAGYCQGPLSWVIQFSKADV